MVSIPATVSLIGNIRKLMTTDTKVKIYDFEIRPRDELLCFYGSFVPRHLKDLNNQQMQMPLSIVAKEDQQSHI